MCGSVILFSGSNNPCIILLDVDIAKVAPEVAMDCFGFTGQVCVATKRIYVHESIFEPFLKALVETTDKTTVGSALDKDTVLGPLQNKMQYDPVKGLLNDTSSWGYRFALSRDWRLLDASPDHGNLTRGFKDCGRGTVW